MLKTLRGLGAVPVIVNIASKRVRLCIFSDLAVEFNL
jgi:hypothetical protein